MEILTVIVGAAVGFIGIPLLLLAAIYLSGCN